ncbi:cytochrome c biogenesis protein CcdA [Candidatus Zixiibacteriota bacterium]
MRSRKSLLIPVIICLLCLATMPLYGQETTGEEPQIITGRVYLDRQTVVPGCDLRIVVEAQIGEEYHINGHDPGDEFLIPTEVRVEEVGGFAFDEAIYPSALERNYEFSDEPMAVYEGTVHLGIAGRTMAEVPPGEHHLEVVLSFQPCDHAACYPPDEVVFPLSVTVVPLGEEMRLINDEIMTKVRWSDEGDAGAGQDDFAALVREKGLLLALVIVFIGGLALNLTPCVFPIIPITISFFTSQSGGRTSRAFQLSLAYFLGITMCFSVLGTIAALTGSLFGALLQNPIVLIFIAGVLVYLALSMFGLYEIPLFTRLQSTTGGAKKGLAGAFLMGLTVGLAASPCIGPFVLGLLVFVGNTGSPLMGFTVFFTLAAGLGLPYIILGTFSGMLGTLPRAGTWMEVVKKILAVILFGLVFYFLRPLIPGRTYPLIFAAYLLVGGVILLVVRTAGEPRGLRLVRILVVAGFLIWGAYSAYAALRPGAGEGLEWTSVSSMARIDQARASGKPVIMDFTASWCTACRELEHKTFTDERVRSAAGDFVLLQVDFSKEDADLKKIREQLGIRGLPTIIFLDRSGQEVLERRQSGFVEPERFLELMQGL